MDDQMGPMQTLEVLAPLLTKPVVNELCSGRKWEDYRKRKEELLRWRIARAWWRQRRLAERVRQQEYRSVDGVGQYVGVFDEELVGLTREKFGRLTFHDPDNRNFILKKHPEFRVPAPKPRYLMWNGFKESTKESRKAGKQEKKEIK